MKVNAINFGNKQKIPANHQEMQKAYAEIYKRVLSGETIPFRIDYYVEKEPEVINLNNKKAVLI